MNASRKSNKQTKTEYLSVNQTTISTKYTLEVSRCIVSPLSASATIFLPPNTAASSCQCPSKDGAATWGHLPIAILFLEKDPNGAFLGLAILAPKWR